MTIQFTREDYVSNKIMFPPKKRTYSAIQPKPSDANRSGQGSDDGRDTETLKPKQKRTNVTSNACLPCQKRKSKCDGARPICSACSNKERQDCTYDFTGDLRRTSALKQQISNLEVQNTSLQVILLYLCEVSGSMDEPGLVQLVKHALEERDVASMAQLARSMLQRRVDSAKTSTGSHQEEISTYASIPISFQRQTSQSSYTSGSSTLDDASVGAYATYPDDPWNDGYHIEEEDQDEEEQI